MYILLAILIFGLLIIVHELGHFIAAKSLGVKVNEFAVCMGPTLLKKNHRRDHIFAARDPHRRLLRHGRGGRGLRGSTRLQ